MLILIFFNTTQNAVWRMPLLDGITKSFAIEAADKLDSFLVGYIER